MRDDAPVMAPYSRHIFVCGGPYCDPDQQTTAIYRRLAWKLDELGDYDNPMRVKRGMTPCLGVCIGGPILVVYPEGIWYHHVDDAVLDRIVDEHLVGGCPVEEYIFHRLGMHSARDEEQTNEAQPHPGSDDGASSR